MKRISSLLSLCSLLLAIPIARAEDAVVTLAWDWTPSGTNPISGFTVYYAPTNQPFPQPPGGLSNNVSPTLKTVTLTNVAPGIYGFAVTAYINQNVGGGLTRVESAPSNVIFYTNRFFGPINLRITQATNQTAALWIEHWPGSAVVERSTDMINWVAWAAIRSYEPGSDIRSLFITGNTRDAALWRVRDTTSTLSPQAAPIPVGTQLR